MQALRFHTRIDASGLIKIPESNYFQNQMVEVIILPRPKGRQQRTSTSGFVDKWSGFLSGSDIDESKYDYLSKKYK